MAGNSSLTEAEFLKSYNKDKYPKPSVTVDLLIFAIDSKEGKNYRKLPEKQFKILLIKRKEHPYKGKWALPGGFVNISEDLQAAALRELKEETGLTNIYLEQLYTFGAVDRDPRMRVISCAYMALIDSSELMIKAGDDAEDASWFTIDYELLKEEKILTKDGIDIAKTISILLDNQKENLKCMLEVKKSIRGNITTYSRKLLDSSNIGFDHGTVIEYGIERIRNKIQYTDIAFSLMPELFTLTELQQVYEIILGKELLAANFRRKISNMVTETNEIKRDAGHRPSKLYKFNPLWDNADF